MVCAMGLVGGLAVASLPAASAAVSSAVVSTTDGFTCSTPTRVLSTLAGLGAPKAKIGAGGTLTLTVPGLPAGTTAVAMNVTMTNPTAAGYLTVYPGRAPGPGPPT